jgi:hypothetical protein
VRQLRVVETTPSQAARQALVNCLRATPFGQVEDVGAGVDEGAGWRRVRLEARVARRGGGAAADRARAVLGRLSSRIAAQLIHSIYGH